MQNPQALLEAAEQVMQVLDRHRTDAVVIGAVAKAAHHDVRGSARSVPGGRRRNGA